MPVLPDALTSLLGPRLLAPSHAERVHALRAGDSEVVPARHAATVVLLREAAGGPEVYLLRRQTTMSFASGMYVFPGGAVDRRDESADIAWVGPASDYWADVFDTSEPVARGLVCAAIRETFEESGVLLAGPDAGTVVADTSGPDWEADRVALIARELSFADFLHRRGLTLRADLVRPWAHWITPSFEPKRFDTRFFVAALPEGQRTREFGEEADRVEWVRPAAAVQRWKDRDMAVMPPTLITMAEIAEFDTVATALAASAEREIFPIQPHPVISGEDVALVLPGHPGYRDPREG